MFDLKEKPNKKEKKEKKAGKKGKTPEVEIDPKMAEQIHVMPQRFYVVPKKKRGGMIFIIIGGVIILAVLAAAGYYLNERLRKSQQQPLANVNQNINQPIVNQNVNTNQPPTNTNQNVNANVNANVSTTTNVNINTNINANVNVNTNTNVNINTGGETPLILPSSPDNDNDNLTTMEEILFGTDPEKSDTDGDGYSDGNELLSGYDPTKPQQSLVQSNLFTRWRHTDYSIIYPTQWQVKELGKDEVVFQATSGEFIEVLIVLNPENLSLLEWYEDQFPEAGTTAVTQVGINQLAGLRSADKLNYYLVDSADLSQIYLLTYNVGNLAQTNFTTTFNVMVKSFSLTP